jgi:anti-sigma B factor antagonist
MSIRSRDVPEPFRTDLEPHRETIVVAAQGEIDMVSAPQLGRQLDELLDAGFRRMVLDLRGVTFIDSTGLRAILEADAASRRAGVEFALVHGPEPMQRIFELTGTEAALHFIDVQEIEAQR